MKQYSNYFIHNSALRLRRAKYSSEKEVMNMSLSLDEICAAEKLSGF